MIKIIEIMEIIEIIIIKKVVTDDICYWLSTYD